MSTVNPTMPEANASKFRSMFWPIYGKEHKKFIPTVLMFFLISFVYSVLRGLKDTFVVTQMDAAAIPYIKTFLVVPGAILYMLYYSKLSNIMSKQKLFFFAIFPFIAFFALFTLVLYPYQEMIHPIEYFNGLAASTASTSLKVIFTILKQWSFAVFYVMAELWGSAVLSLMFWGFANDITEVSQAKRFYGMLGIGANIALAASGKMLGFTKTLSIESIAKGPFAFLLPASGTKEALMAFNVNMLGGIVILSAFLVLFIYYYMQSTVLKDPELSSAAPKKKKKKAKLSMMEGIKFLATSKYLAMIAIMVLAYNISINLVEVTWKAQIKEYYPNSVDYQAFMGQYQMYLGAFTIFMMMFVSSNVLRTFGWLAGALITPVVLLITGAGFFAFLLFGDLAPVKAVVEMIGITPLAIAIIFGTIQNIASKACKYSLFDPTKEMAYIPLDEESKVKGKAAIDVVGGRLGKAGGSVIQMGLISLFGSMSAILAPIGVISTLIIVIWIYAVKDLGVRFEKATSGKEDESKSVSKDATEGATATA